MSGAVRDVSISVVIIVAIAAVLIHHHIENTRPESVDYRVIAEELVARRGSFVTGTVEYRKYDFVFSKDACTELATMLASTHQVGRPSLRADVSVWLDSQLPDSVAAWAGRCAFDGDIWMDQKQRIEGVDTTLQMLHELAEANNAQPMPIVNHVLRQCDGQVITIIEDGSVVFTRVPSDHVHPMMPLDISLAPWEDAIELGANVPGQEILAEIDGGRRTIRYQTVDDDPIVTDYVFDAMREFAPLECACPAQVESRSS